MFQPTDPHCAEDNVDVPVHAQAEEVPSALPSPRAPLRLDPAKAKKRIDRIRRFRILVMGRANAGKTTILQRVCNTTDQPEIFNGKGEKVDDAVVQGSLTRGHHNIEDELVFQSNPGFVFHDSCGFEAGSEEQFDIMKKFVRDCAKTTKLDERIHAIWFCIPLNESHRMVMAAEKKFFHECDTGHVPVIVLLTKADTLALDAVQELMNKGKSLDDAMKEATDVEKGILGDCVTRVKDWLNKERFPPKDYLSLTGMQQQGAECAALLTCTANALKEEGLQQLLISTQQSNLELCMEFAIIKSLKECMKTRSYDIQPSILAFYMSMWFPYLIESMWG
ncbi:GTP-binding protein [Pisolithus croceorrhizus]|nr:GTP-binding protein [Pisolithus croceorrhizus]